MTANGDSEASVASLDYIPLVPYNGTEAQGANPLLFNVNVWYDVSLLFPGRYRDTKDSSCKQAGDMAWMIMATALVLLMIPGVG